MAILMKNKLRDFNVLQALLALKVILEMNYLVCMN